MALNSALTVLNSEEKENPPVGRRLLTASVYARARVLSDESAYPWDFLAEVTKELSHHCSDYFINPFVDFFERKLVEIK